jgi:alginate O-acetyltransferase complex protein AlgI
MIGWVMFRAETMGYACQYIQHMFGIGQKTASSHSFEYFFSPFDLAVMAVAIICSVPLFKGMFIKRTTFWGKVLNFATDIWLLLLFVLSAASIANATFNPFIYFRF